MVEELAVPAAPTAASALRAALNAYFYNSWRLVPANIIWGVVLLAAFGLLYVSIPIALLVFLFVLPFPTAGMFRLSALIVRGEPATLSDALAWRSFGPRALGAGLLIGGSSVVLGFNIALGIASVDPIGWATATAAFWGLVVLWLVAASVWPLLFDPLRTDESATSLVRLALIVALVKPLRYLILVGILTIVLVVSAILAVALLTVSAAFFALAMSFYAIHAADRIEQRRTIVVTG